MARYEDEDEGDLQDWEDPDQSDMDDDDDDGPDLVPCPYCRREISEDAEVCPKCGSYITGEDAPRSGTALLIVIGLVLIAVALIEWIIFRR